MFAVWAPAAITFAGSFVYDADAVTIELFCMPKETLFEFEKTMVPEVLPVWAPAAITAPGVGPYMLMVRLLYGVPPGVAEEALMLIFVLPGTMKQLNGESTFVFEAPLDIPITSTFTMPVIVLPFMPKEQKLLLVAELLANITAPAVIVALEAPTPLKAAEAVI